MITAQDSSPDDASVSAALALSLPSLALDLPLSPLPSRSLRLLAPPPSSPPPFTQQSALTWPRFFQLRHSTSFLLEGFFLSASSAAKASSCDFTSFRRTLFSYSHVAARMAATGVTSLSL